MSHTTFAHLTKTQLAHLHEYKYRAEDRSITYRFLLSPFYNRLVTFLPRWLAPNAVTLLGFSFPFFAHLLVIYYYNYNYHHHTEQQLLSKGAVIPQWLHLFCSFALLWYMIMDNLDGKQARRTKSSSPLGQLFDHGCDALNVTVTGILILPCISIPTSLVHPMVASMYISIAGAIPFYTATVEEFHTGVLILQEINGPNEGLLLLSIVHLLKAFDFFTTRVVLFSKTVEVFIVCMFGFICIAGNVLRTWIAVKHWKFLRSFTLFLAFPILQMLVTKYVHIEITQRFLMPLLWQCGLVCYDFVTRVMIATLTKSNFPYLIVPSSFSISSILISSALFVTVPFIVMHFAVLISSFSSPIFTIVVVYTSLSISIVYSIWRTCKVVNEITESLKIYCFSLSPPPPPPISSFSSHKYHYHQKQ